MKMHSRRYQRHRNPERAEKKETPFFSKAPQNVQAKEEPFFQPKLTIGQPGDELEKEADTMGAKAANETTGGPVPEPKREEDTVQRVPLREEEKIPSVQMQSLPEEKEKKVQRQEVPEEEEKLQKKEVPKEEEDKLHKKDLPEREKEGLQAKSENTASPGSPALAAQLDSSKGHGQALPAAVQAQMESSFGADFSRVAIHTGSDAIQMNLDLGAQAFTHGADIYFNSGKYDTASSTGKSLLAHELTHVVQQGAAGPMIQRQAAPAQTTQQVPGISTPVPTVVQPQPSVEIRMVVSGVTVMIRRDVHSNKSGTGAITNFQYTGGNITKVRQQNGQITSFAGPSAFTVSIRTTYQKGANPQSSSGYGRGTTALDIAAGNTTLRFHEGSHGTNFLDYLRANALPVFNGAAGMPVQQFNQELVTYHQAVTDYFRDMENQSTQDTDCVGTTIDQATGTQICVP